MAQSREMWVGDARREEMETEGDRQRDIWRERRRCVVVGVGGAGIN